MQLALCNTTYGACSINDLPGGADSAVKLFADDTKIFNKVNTADDEDTLQRNDECVCHWSMKWQLNVNTKHVKDRIFVTD